MPIAYYYPNSVSAPAYGSQDATARANERWELLLAAQESPPLDPSVAEALDGDRGRLWWLALYPARRPRH